MMMVLESLSDRKDVVVHELPCWGLLFLLNP